MLLEEFVNSKNTRDCDAFVLNYLSDDPRLLRLFAVACCYRIWDLIEIEDFKTAVKIAEVYADSQEKSNRQALLSYKDIIYEKERSYRDVYHYSYHEKAFRDWCLVMAVWTITCDRLISLVDCQNHCHAAFQVTHRESFRPIQAIMLQNMKGKWQNHYNTSTVNSIAKTIYDNKSYDLFPILADALQDAGCDDEEMLEYCRNSGSFFFRGCWVLDKATGKR